MYVASVRPGLRGYVRDAISTDDVATQVISLGEGQFNLGPARHIVRSVTHFKREVPHHSSVGLLRFVRMLAHSTFVALNKLHHDRLVQENNDLG